MGAFEEVTLRTRTSRSKTSLYVGGTFLKEEKPQMEEIQSLDRIVPFCKEVRMVIQEWFALLLTEQTLVLVSLRRGLEKLGSNSSPQ